MEMEREKVFNPAAVWTAERSRAFASLMSKVYVWMTLALAVTGLTAAYVGTNSGLVSAVFSNSATMWVLVLAELALVWVLSANIHRLSFPVAGLMFIAYSVLNGVTLSLIFVVYTMTSIATTFFVTAGTFAVMSLVGMAVKRDLSPIGRILFMALIGLIIATIVNLFVASSALSWAITYIGVLVFVGLTAYDTQKIKFMMLQYGDGVNDATMKLALMGSLTLYLDFVNLFLYLLRIFGNNK